MSDFTPDTDELVSDTTPMIPASDEHSSEYSDVQETPQTITNANDILHAIDNHADIPDREAAREPVTSPGTVEHEDNE